jgi:hypothetical protein
MSIVSQSVIAKPRQAPRRTLSAAAAQYQGDRASTSVAQLLTTKSE